MKKKIKGHADRGMEGELWTKKKNEEEGSSKVKEDDEKTGKDGRLGRPTNLAFQQISFGKKTIRSKWGQGGGTRNTGNRPTVGWFVTYSSMEREGLGGDNKGKS